MAARNSYAWLPQLCMAAQHMLNTHQFTHSDSHPAALSCMLVLAQKPLGLQACGTKCWSRHKPRSMHCVLLRTNAQYVHIDTCSNKEAAAAVHLQALPLQKSSRTAEQHVSHVSPLVAAQCCLALSAVLHKA
jgi:hypothetical protein